MESVKTVVLLLFLPLAYCVVYFVSEVHTKAYTDSPDGLWRAAVRERRESSVFASPEFCVTLQPNDYWVHLSRGKTIFAIEKNAVSQPQLEWRSPGELVVKLTGKTATISLAEQISKQRTQYDGVRISYETLSAPVQNPDRKVGDKKAVDTAP